MFIALREKIKSTFYGNPIVWPMLIGAKNLWYKANYQYYYKTNLGKNQVSLREINLEFNSTCNLRCRFCALDFAKTRQIMSPEVLNQILEEIIHDDRLVNISRINLYNGGETLLHPDRLQMFQLIGEAKAKAAKLGKKFPQVLLLTNGMLLRESLAKQILQTKALDIIQFSLDGGTPERFEHLRVNAKWPVFRDNVHALANLIKTEKLPVALKSITIIEEPLPLNTKWMHSEFVEIINLMAHHELRRLHDWGGEVDIKKEKHKTRNTGCTLLMHQMVVLPNGDVTVCCNDLNSKGVVGNLKGKNLFDVYHSAERRQYLDKLYQGKKQELELCKNCEVF
jgi:radical SAM protein with 4Fe4S-binding SPASM domain